MKGQMTTAAEAKRDGSAASWHPLIPAGTAEALKWLALVLMVLDHINKYLLQASAPALFAAGRLVFPLFAFLLAAQLARPGARQAGLHARVLHRLGGAGAVASVPLIGLGGLAWGWYPLNVMATLACGTMIVALLDQARSTPRLLAGLVFLFGGAVVEFWWPGLALFVAAWWLHRSGPTGTALFGLALAVFAFLFATPWPMLCVPMLAAASQVDLKVPRIPHVFYVAYPLHLAVLWAFQCMP